MKNIYPCIWHNGTAAEAAVFYNSIFPDSHTVSENPVVVISSLSSEKFMWLNGGPMYKPTPAISYMVTSETNEGTTDLYNKLIGEGTIMMPLGEYAWSTMYGWVQDKYGVSWQLYTGKLNNVNQQVFSPTLMFTGVNCGKATEAIHFYLSVFKQSQLQGILHYGPGEGDSENLVKHGQFILNDFVFMAMDSSHEHGFTFTEGNSFVIECIDQAEIDYYWDTLTRNGQESMCGWLKDKYGVSWQVVPKNLGAIMSNTDKGPGAMNALMKMKKIIIRDLENN